MLIAVELHGEIRAVIPDFVDLLQSDSWKIRFAAVSGIVKLTEQGEFN